jgi:hypothetical protein
MSESDSVLNRIRSSRQRAVVPPREDALLPVASQQSESQPNSLTNVEQLKAELAKFPPTRRHSAIVLDQEVDQKLTRFCKDSGITVEVFLEATWLKADSDPALMKEILAEAKLRYAARKQAGKLRRLITMLSGQ